MRLPICSRVRRAQVATCVSSLAALAACGNTAHGKATDAPAKSSDAPAPGGDAPRDSTSQRICALPASYTGTTADQQAVNYGGRSLDATEFMITTYTQDLEWHGNLGGSGSATQVMTLDAFSGGGSATPDWPTGDVTAKSGINLAATSDIGWTISTDANGSGVPQVYYLAIAGTLDITSVSPSLAGSATNLMFVHYDLDANGAFSEPDADGCTTSIPSMSFTATVILPG